MELVALAQTRHEAKRGVRWGRIALIAALLVLAAGAVFAVRQALGQPAGPGTPEEAVGQLFEAIDNEDILGVIELLAPSEREA